jgi:membrane-bound lytic murein transglycosylase B
MFTLPKSFKYLTFYLISLMMLFAFILSSIDLTIAQEATPEERSRLEAELRDLEAESAKIQAQLSGKKGERAGLERDLSIIAGKISASKNSIKKIELTIKKISGEIGDREDRIVTLDNKIESNKKYIASSLYELKKLDDIRAVIALSKNTALSEVFVDREDYRSIQNSLSDTVDNLKNNKKFVEVEKEVLEDKKDETEALKKKQEAEKRKVEETKKEKNVLLTVTKGEEKEYASALAEKQKRVTQIKNRLFALRDTGAISFDRAQKLAKDAGKVTGVRAALILAILKQESNLGANVGRCYLTDENGNGVHVKTGEIMSRTMKASRDVQPFLAITKSLGLDPYKTAVSCPIAGIGFGGAMGPTQFIPSTWISYQSRVSAITGNGGNPWNAQDAITATALYLSDGGANGGNYTSERNAACKYYSGRGCSSSSAGAGYGNSVMRHAENFQKDIDLLSE